MPTSYSGSPVGVEGKCDAEWLFFKKKPPFTALKTPWKLENRSSRNSNPKPASRTKGIIAFLDDHDLVAETDEK